MDAGCGQGLTAPKHAEFSNPDHSVCHVTPRDENKVPSNATAMPKEATEIEVEVVEIDGLAPTTPQVQTEETRSAGDWQDWRQWQGKVRTLDSRWWPLWAFLGIIAVFLLLTIGLVIGVIFVIIRLISKILRAIFR
jgi:hypothetical protein